MTIKLTERQINHILDNISKEQFIDYLANDVEGSVDWICKFFKQYVDSEILQTKIKRSLPPIQMELFND